MCLRATAASPLARTGGGTRPLAGEELASKHLASGIKGLIMLLRPSFRKGTAELTYRNRDMGSILVRLDCNVWWLVGAVQSYLGESGFEFQRCYRLFQPNFCLLFLASPEASRGYYPQYATTGPSNRHLFATYY